MSSLDGYLLVRGWLITPYAPKAAAAPSEKRSPGRAAPKADQNLRNTATPRKDTAIPNTSYRVGRSRRANLMNSTEKMGRVEMRMALARAEVRSKPRTNPI